MKDLKFSINPLYADKILVGEHYQIYLSDSGAANTAEGWAWRGFQIRYDLARRIVACVNACEGLPESALKPGIIMAQVIQAQELIAQRDELLAALERLLPWAECMEYAPPGMEFSGDHPIAVARAAIARIKGGAA